MALAAPVSYKESEKRLKALAPAAATRDKAVNWARGDLSQQRTFHIPRAAKAEGTAEFFVVLKADGAVEDVKFIDGNSGMGEMAAALKKAQFHFTLPSASDAKIVRRGIMRCTAAATCDFVVLNVDTVRNLF